MESITTTGKCHATASNSNILLNLTTRYVVEGLVPQYPAFIPSMIH